MKQFQTALAGISNAALKAGELPTRIKILNWGDNPSDKGNFRVTAASAAALRQQIAGKAFERILLDFEHSSLKGHPNYQPPPRKHVGMGNLEIVDQDGVYLSAIEYTPAGREFARENSDLSPVLQHDDAGTVLGVLSVALLPNGSLHNVTFFSAEVPSSAAGAQPETTKKETQMAETALEASVNTLTAENKKLREDLTALQAKLPSAQVTALETKVTALETKIAVLETADLKRAKDAILESATLAGKVVALEATVIAKMDVAELKTHVEKLPVTVPLSARTPRAAKQDPAQNDLMAQYNAITDPAERARFYSKNRKALSGC